MTVRASIYGLQEAQAANERVLAAVKPSGALGRALQWALATSQRWAIANTPVDSGAWRASHRTELRGVRGRLYLAPGAKNPRSGEAVTAYAGVWEERKGRYAIYRRLEADESPQIAAGAIRHALQELP
jgi:hypothetical protein